MFRPIVLTISLLLFFINRDVGALVAPHRGVCVYNCPQFGGNDSGTLQSVETSGDSLLCDYSDLGNGVDFTCEYKAVRYQYSAFT